MDTLTLSGLQYHARHGVHEKERTEGNAFEVDLVFHAKLKQAGLEDDLSATINYEDAEEVVRKVMNGPSVHLIETLAAQIGAKLFARFNQVLKLDVRVRKLDPPLPTPTEYSEVACSWTR